MTSNSPWLSVIMPTYNATNYLPCALDGLVAQEDQDFEVIAIDDGSTDATLDLLRAYSNRLTMRIVKQDHTGNWIAAANLGIRMAEGRYLSILHHDDTWSSNRVRQLKRCTARWPAASLLLHPARFVDSAGRVVGTWRCPLPSNIGTLGPQHVLGPLLIQNFIAPPAPLIRTETARQVGGMDEELWYTADWDFWLRLVRVCQTAYYSFPLVSYRIHATSGTSTTPGRIEELRSEYEKVLAKHLEDGDAGIHDRVSRFSVEMNLALMRLVGGQRVGWPRLIGAFAKLGPLGWYRYLRCSRILERGTSRVRAGLLRGVRRRSEADHPSHE